jgi:hypothetical protein
MAGSRRASVASRACHDLVRIVPLHAPDNVPRRIEEAAVGAPTVKFTYRRGPLIGAAEVFTIFWGSAWKKSPALEHVDRLNRFFDVILSSGLIDQLGEYDTAKYTIRRGRRTGSATLTKPAPPRSLTDEAVQRFLRQQIAGRGVPKATPNTIFFIYLPPGVTVAMGGSRSCQAFCGYHSAVAGKTFYAVMPYPGCTGCTGGLTAFDALTSTSSHELCEAITDPNPGTGWYDDANGEIGDVCAWETKEVGGYTVQLEWSNRSRRCV